MKVDYRQLEQAEAERVLGAGQAARLWAFLQAEGADRASFRPGHILYYLGGMVAIGAMSLFMTLGWEDYGGKGLIAIGLCYAVLGAALAEWFGRRPGLAIPQGICAAFVIALTPLVVYGIQVEAGLWDGTYHYQDFHRWVDWRWLIMELATLAAGAVVIFRYRLPFLLMPVAATLWYMSMDLALWAADPDDYAAVWEMRQWVSVWFGLLMVLFAFWVDIRSRASRHDYPFWLYLFGVMTFWGGLSSMSSDSEWNKFIYLCLNLLLVAVGAALSRRVFAVFGGLGVAGYLGHLAWEVFKDSLLFPVALAFLGFAIIWLGVLWQRHEAAINRRILSLLPGPLAELLSRRAGGPGPRGGLRGTDG